MYTIQAILADLKVIQSSKGIVTTIIPLPQDKAMVPLSTSLRDSFNIPFLPLTDQGLDQLPSSIAELCHNLSASGKLAYIEAEFFGGQGMQACSLWDKGTMVAKPYVALYAINEALQFLGVEKSEGIDEFDTLKLSHFRETDEWLSEAGA